MDNLHSEKIDALATELFGTCDTEDIPFLCFYDKGDTTACLAAGKGTQLIALFAHTFISEPNIMNYALIALHSVVNYKLQEALKAESNPEQT